MTDRWTRRPRARWTACEKVWMGNRTQVGIDPNSPSRRGRCRPPDGADRGRLSDVGLCGLGVGSLCGRRHSGREGRPAITPLQLLRLWPRRRDRPRRRRLCDLSGRQAGFVSDHGPNRARNFFVRLLVTLLKMEHWRHSHRPRLWASVALAPRADDAPARAVALVPSCILTPQAIEGPTISTPRCRGRTSPKAIPELHCACVLS
jgi:hypothetical protein